MDTPKSGVRGETGAYYFRLRRRDKSVLCEWTGRTQSMKIDDRKSNRSIDANRCMLVNWHRLVSANR